MNDHNRILLDRIAVLEHEKEELKEKLKKKYWHSAFDGMAEICCTAIVILLVLVFGLGMSYDCGYAAALQNQCSKWCENRIETFPSAQDYSNCLKQCSKKE